MKFKLFFCLAFVLGGGLVGCSTARRPVVIMPGPDKTEIKLPIHFSNYRELYLFMAKYEGIPTSADAVFQFAADSETEIYTLDELPSYVWVIMPHFFNGGIFDEIRGAQGNGSIYLVHPLARNFASDDTNRGFELIGIAEGNAYRFASINQIPRLITNWHISAGEHPESIYEWNGKFFAQLPPDKSSP